MPDDETPDNQPEQEPSDANAAEASGDPGEIPEAAGDAEAEGSSESAAPEPAADGGEESAAGAKAGEGTVAEDLAAQALKAAQEAVSGINSGGGEEGDAGDDASASADAAMAAMMEQQGGAGDGAKPLTMPSLDAGGLADAPAGIGLLSDVNLDVTIELGRTRMYVEDVLKLAEGAVVELDKLAGDPVDIYVNQRLVAKGEVLILNENFCVRINEIVQLTSEAAAG